VVRIERRAADRSTIEIVALILIIGKKKLEFLSTGEPVLSRRALIGWAERIECRRSSIVD